jgi:flavorubredoxin
MKPRRIRENVYWMGAVDWDRRLFDSLIPLPDGTSYNAYLVEGSEKTALMDTVDPNKEDGRTPRQRLGRSWGDRASV